MLLVSVVKKRVTYIGINPKPYHIGINPKPYHIGINPKPYHKETPWLPAR